MLNAIILAGDSNNSPAENSESKALLKIKEKFMIEYIIDSLREAECIDKIVVVGDKEALNNAIGVRVDNIIHSGDSIMENMKMGIDSLGKEKHILVCTSDIPMVSGEAIDDFARQCRKQKVDIGYPIIDKVLNDAKYPDVKRTYVKMKDGVYTGGNIIYINPLIADELYEAAEELIANRKNALKMARVFGVWTLIKLSLGMLKIQSVEDMVKRRFGINAKAIKTMYPEIGNDVDKPDDVDFVNKYINAGA